jgi:hypothetical protein
VVLGAGASVTGTADVTGTEGATVVDVLALVVPRFSSPAVASLAQPASAARRARPAIRRRVRFNIATFRQERDAPLSALSFRKWKRKLRQWLQILEVHLHDRDR